MTEQPLHDHEHDVSTDRRRRLSFGTVAEQYDRHRPGYPETLVDDVLEYAGAGPGDRALDVGAGTGRATLMFARRGLRVTAVEPDPSMAAVASQRAATAGLAVEIVSADFEAAFATGAVPEHGFRLLISATAWHWVTPSQRNGLAARALAPGGALAAFWNRPVWESNPLCAAIDAAYGELADRFDARPGGPMNPRGAPLEIKSDQEWLREEFRDNGDFAGITVRRYRWPQTYTSAEYVALLATHSDHILLAPAAKERLFASITAAIDAAGGSFELSYQTLLCLARRSVS